MTTQVNIPLDNYQTTLELPPFCVYCAQPVEQTAVAVELRREYTPHTWKNTSQKGKRVTPELLPVIDENGHPVIGSVTLHAHYCPQHNQYPRGLRLLPYIGGIIGIIAAIIGIIYIYPVTNAFQGAWYVVVAIGSLAAALTLGALAFTLVYVVGRWIAGLISSEARETPREGHIGLGMDIKEQYDRSGKGAVRYDLVVKFANAEIARLCQNALPQAKPAGE